MLTRQLLTRQDIKTVIKNVATNENVLNTVLTLISEHAKIKLTPHNCRFDLNGETLGILVSNINWSDELTLEYNDVINETILAKDENFQILADEILILCVNVPIKTIPFGFIQECMQLIEDEWDNELITTINERKNSLTNYVDNENFKGLAIIDLDHIH